LRSIGSALIIEVIAQRIAVRWRKRFRWRCGLVVRTRDARTLGAVSDVLLEPIPLRLLRVLVLLTRIDVFSTRTPIAVASRCSRVALPYGTIVIAIGPRPFPSALSLPATGVTRCVTRFPQGAALEPAHHRRWVLLFQSIKSGQQLLRVVRAESCGLVVHKNRPIRVARRHLPIILRSWN
jgi:hypothetical protein